MNRQIELVADGFDFPEGPAFDADGTLYITQCGNGWISRIAGGESADYVHSGSTPNGLAFDESGGLWIAEAGTNQLLRYDGEELTEIAAEWGGKPLWKPNDLVFHPDGTLFMTGPGGSNAETPVGVVYHVTREGDLRVVADGLAFPNGLALTEDASRLYVVETHRHQIIVYDVGEGGALDGGEQFAEMPGGVGGDGMALDVDGNLYVAHFGMGEVAVFSADGGRIGTLPAGGEKPTNVAFGGNDMRGLYVTEVETGAVYRLEPGVEGLRPFCDPRG
ncbi:MAG: SMP-30/gluconolactonase/LRE family protein [Armatimonadota bacterium]|jgi:gluconolactonase